MVHQAEIFYINENVTVRRAEFSDIKIVAENMRESDVREIWASHHHTPDLALEIGIKNSLICFTIEYKNYPVAMFGLYAESLLGNRGVIWFLGTNKLNRMKSTFVRSSKKFIKYLLSWYPYLYNYVDVRNQDSIKWLLSCGAKLRPPVRFGKDQEWFQYFSFERQ